MFVLAHSGPHTATKATSHLPGGRSTQAIEMLIIIRNIAIYVTSTITCESLFKRLECPVGSRCGINKSVRVQADAPDPTLPDDMFRNLLANTRLPTINGCARGCERAWSLRG